MKVVEGGSVVGAGEWGPVSTAEVPAAARARWCVLSTVARAREPWPLVLFEDAAGGAAGGRHYLGRARRDGRYRTVAFVPEAAARCRLFTRTASALRFAPVSRAWAAALILLEGGRGMAGVLRLAAAGDVRRARTALVLLAASLHRPQDYRDWRHSFDRWPEPPGAARVPIGALVFARDTGGPALAATLAGLAAQGLAATVARAGADWRAALPPGEYVALLQAGELLAGHAGWFAAEELARLGRPPLAYADEDRLEADGLRSAPTFRPAPGRFLMLSGTLARGVWFVRRDVLLAHADGPADVDAGWAECLRLALWLRRDETGPETDTETDPETDTETDTGRTAAEPGVRLPVILTQRRWDAEAAPPEAVAAVVGAHLARTGLAMRAVAGPGRVTVRASPLPGQARGRVSVLVPSTLRTPLAVRCLRSVGADLVGHDVEIVVGVSQAGALDAAQAAAAAALAAVGVCVVHLPFATFNFSRVCNALAGMTAGALILLLNDDVSVTAPGWLDAMAAPLGDARVGIVGARLLYPDRTVQHGGVLMGLSGLCDHASRGLAADDPRATLLREVSAVTAACLLVRRSVYEAAGGLDEAYPSAFNDVDFCLRVGEAGHRVVYAPEAALIHHEMQTYGSHYKGDRAPFEAEETARMRRRWADLVANDPWHSPNLDLAPGREWALAFPPRRPRTFEVVPR